MFHSRVLGEVVVIVSRVVHQLVALNQQHAVGDLAQEIPGGRGREGNVLACHRGMPSSTLPVVALPRPGRGSTVPIQAPRIEVEHDFPFNLIPWYVPHLSWLTAMTAPWNWRMASSSISLEGMSRWLVGSSNTSSVPLLHMNLASARRAFSPPDSTPTCMQLVTRAL